MQKIETDFRDILRRKYVERSSKNPRYSLRAFARDIGLSPSRLSEVMHGKQNLSRRSAFRIAGNIGFRDPEKAYFCSLVAAQESSSPTLKNKALAELQVLRSRLTGYLLKDDIYKLIADWQHAALIAYHAICNKFDQPEKIAHYLGTSPEIIHTALTRLVRLGILKKSGKTYELLDTFFQTAHEYPSAAVKKSHLQLLELAQRAVTKQRFEERSLDSLVLAVKKEDLDDAKKTIRAFVQDFDRRFSVAQDADAVYCLGVQLFALGRD